MRAQARGIPAASIAAVAFLGAAMALHPVMSEDLFWHIAGGRWILEHRELPRTDPFTYTLSDRPWTNLQWLGDVLASRIWEWAGADGIVLTKGLAFAAIGVLLVAAGRAGRAGFPAASAGATLALLACAERTMERPEVATYVLLAATMAIGWRALARGTQRPALLLLLLVAIHALWANLHALAFLGPLALALLALAGRSRVLAAGAAGAALALLANPYGIAVWTFPRTLFQRISGEERAFSDVLEFASPLQAPGDRPLLFFWVLVASFVVLLAARSLTRGRAPAPFSGRAALVLVVLPFLVLALLARRNVPLFAIVLAPFLARGLDDLAARFVPAGARARLTWFPAAAALVLALAVLRGASPALFGLWRDRGLGVEPGLFPEACLESLERAPLVGPLFNDLDFGGYISWRNPERKTFLDGRLEVAGPERLATYVAAHRSESEWRRLESSYGFDALLIEHSSPGSAAFLLKRLRENWRLARLDPQAALLVREDAAARIGLAAADSSVRPASEDWTRVLGEHRGPEPHAGRALAGFAGVVDLWLRRAQGEPRNSPVRAACRLANACLTLGWIDDARMGYERVLAVAPRDPEALFNRGICELREGREESAREHWRRALPLVDRVTRRRIQEALASMNETR